MQIHTSVDAVSVGSALPTQVTPAQGDPSRVSFSEIFDQIKGKLGMSEAHQATVGIQQQLLSQSAVSPQQLLLYQIKVQELHLRTELLSKVGETVTSSVRKLQNSQ